MDTLDKFFREVGKEVLASVENCLPLNPTDDQMQDLVASEEDKHYLHGVSKEKFREALVKPIREVTDRGGKGWRSFALLACCESVGKIFKFFLIFGKSYTQPQFKRLQKRKKMCKENKRL